MHPSIPNIIKGLSLERLFSKLASSSTLASVRRNHDIQPLKYSSKKQHKPMQSASLSSDVKKHKRMSTLKDKRILK